MSREVVELFCRECHRRLRAPTRPILYARAERHARNCNAVKAAERLEESTTVSVVADGAPAEGGPEEPGPDHNPGNPSTSLGGEL